MWLQTIIGFAALSDIVIGYAILPHEVYTPANTSTIPGELAKRGGDPSDFTWVKRWAAIGDSYTAGIGAGVPLGRISTDKLEINIGGGKVSGHGDWYCARYNRAYPKVIEQQFGSHVQDFQYLACSGDRSEQIYQQAQQLKADLDFVTLTAGGNDLCLAKMIKDCIMLPYWKKDACETAIKKAEENIDTIIKENIRQILKELNNKVKKDGIVVINGYAQFFDANNDECEHEAWDTAWWIPFRRSTYEPLTKARRERFNNLVLGINKAIGDVVDEIAADSNIGYKIGFGQWDDWAKAVDGQMCSSKSNGQYPDSNQPDMQFIKPDTHPWVRWSKDVSHELRRRDVQTLDDLTPEERRTYLHWEAEMTRRAEVYENSVYNSILYKTPAPAAEALHQLDKRAPAPPNCPGDGDKDWTLGLGLPNTVGRNFHPNINGHVSIASFVLAEAMDLRAVVLNTDPYCAVKSQRTCTSSDSSARGYTQADRLDISYKDFCENFVPGKQPSQAKNWQLKNTYDRGTPEEHEYTITLGNDLADHDKKKCLDSFRSLIHDCDTNNKMNFKQGGKFVVDGGDFTFEVYSKRTSRPWPWPSDPVGRCEGWWKVGASEYELEGGGWSSYDFGQKTLLPNMNGCYGLGTTQWKFNYYDKPTKDGYEWKATFVTPVFVRNRCFANNKVVRGAGGWTNGCGGNDG